MESPTTAAMATMDEVDFAEWRRIMSVNLDGTFLTCYHAQRPMREAGYGRIVNFSSISYHTMTANLAVYLAFLKPGDKRKKS